MSAVQAGGFIGMEENLVALVLADMSSALFAMHKNNLIHRDIKPENIFVTNTGSFKVRVEEMRADGITCKVRAINNMAIIRSDDHAI
eukprot:761263-Prorocentrum_minimum.AAC.1